MLTFLSFFTENIKSYFHLLNRLSSPMQTFALKTVTYIDCIQTIYRLKCLSYWYELKQNVLIPALNTCNSVTAGKRRPKSFRRVKPAPVRFLPKPLCCLDSVVHLCINKVPNYEICRWKKPSFDTWETDWCSLQIVFSDTVTREWWLPFKQKPLLNLILKEGQMSKQNKKVLALQHVELVQSYFARYNKWGTMWYMHGAIIIQLKFSYCSTNKNSSDRPI